MASQSNLIFGVRVKDLPEHVRDDIEQMDSAGEEYSEAITKELDDAMRLEWESVVQACDERGLLRVKRKALRPWEVGVIYCGEYDETLMDHGWIGVGITSRYAATLADDSDSGGAWPFVFDDRLREITALAEAAIKRAMPAWFRDANPVWIVKEEFY